MDTLTVRERQQAANKEMVEAANKAALFRKKSEEYSQGATYWSQIEEAARTLSIHLDKQANRAEESKARFMSRRLGR